MTQEERLTRIETELASNIEHTRTDVADIRAEMRSLRLRIDGIFIAIAVSTGGILAAILTSG